MKYSLFLFLTFISIASCKSSEAPLSLNYLVKEPNVKIAHPRTLILLHGVGSNAQDMFALANQFPENYLVISAQAPIELGHESYAWYHLNIENGKLIYSYEEAEKSRKILLQFIQEIKQKYQLNSEDIYLVGFSQGAIMSYNIGLTEPTSIKGIAVMSGRLMQELKEQITLKDKLKNLRIFVSHGTEDNTLAVLFAREAVAYLRALDLSPDYHEYPDGHTIDAAMMRDLLIWLAK